MPQTAEQRRKSHIAAVDKYHAVATTRIGLRLPNADAATVDAAAATAGQSRTAYIMQAVRERIARDAAAADAAWPR